MLLCLLSVDRQNAQDYDYVRLPALIFGNVLHVHVMGACIHARVHVD